MMIIGLLSVSAAAADPATYAVEVTCDSFYGTVTGGGSYEEGDTVTLTATPVEDAKFVYWLDAEAQLDEEPAEEELKAAIASYDAEYTFTATKDVTLKAVFFVANEIPIVPLLITDTDDESLMDAEWVDREGDYDTITLGAESISLPGEIIEDIITIGDQQYQFAGFIVFGYDEATDTETVELKETMTIDAMPLYNSAEYWEWFVPISDGLYAAYMEYTPEEDEPQEPTDPQTPDDPEVPSVPQTGDNNHAALCVVLLFISVGAIIPLAVTRRKSTDRL